LAEAREDDAALVAGLLEWMARAGADFTNTFRGLADGTVRPVGDEAFAAWHAGWMARVTAEGASWDEAQRRMREANPVVVPRNHMVEAALAAAEHDDLVPLHALLASVTRPYADGPWHDGFREPGPPRDTPYQTFCGT
jgi:uncharacterized protein YdiU (UPF0061 family)